MSASYQSSQSFSNRELEDLASSDSLQDPPPYRHGSSPDLFPSRASSIISTGTRTTLGTMINDPQESFEVQLRTGSFRVGLDGRVVPVSQPGRSWRSDLESTYDLSPDPAVERRYGSSPAGDLRRSLTSASRPYEHLERRGSSNSQVGEHGTQWKSVSRKHSFTPGKEIISISGRHRSIKSIAKVDGSPGDPAEAPLGEMRRRRGLKIGLDTRPVAGQSGLDNVPSGAGSYRTTESYIADGEGEQSRSPADVGQYGNGLSSTPVQNDHERWQVAPNDNKVVAPEVETVHDSGDNVRPKLDIRNRLVDALGLDANGNRPFSSAVRAKSSDSGIDMSEDHGTSSGTLAESPDLISEGNDAVHNLPLVELGQSPNHKLELDGRCSDNDKTQQMIAALAQHVIDLKTELVRTKSELRANSFSEGNQQKQVSSRHPVTRQASTEGHSFYFPPLKLNNIRILKTALKRRAEKIKRGIHDDFGRSSRETVSPPLPSQETATVSGAELFMHADETVNDARQDNSSSYLVSNDAEDNHREESVNSDELASIPPQTPSQKPKSNSALPGPSPSAPSTDPTTSNTQEHTHTQTQLLTIRHLEDLLQKSQQLTAFYAARCQDLEQKQQQQQQA
ncbi:MAG: hypothetical protein M1837_004381 [Sclerophora amabilis]|nr:MAG: hypothetical protein M1837_004381 [Sclerophora amabilis]